MLYHSKKISQIKKQISQIKKQITQIRTQIREETTLTAQAAQIPDGEEHHTCSQAMSRMTAAQKTAQSQDQGQQEMGTEEV